MLIMESNIVFQTKTLFTVISLVGKQCRGKGKVVRIALVKFYTVRRFSAIKFNV